MQARILSFGFGLAMLAVLLGAFGAHGLEQTEIAPELLEAYKTASQYHFYVAFSLMALGLCSGLLPDKALRWSFSAFLLGAGLFCGSLYIMAIADAMGNDWGFLGMITPIGGTAMMLAYGIAAWGFYQRARKQD
jgi:uncharacterized membrane protein YgdD (TMEM256/DUF423 family)